MLDRVSVDASVWNAGDWLHRGWSSPRSCKDRGRPPCPVLVVKTSRVAGRSFGDRRCTNHDLCTTADRNRRLLRTQVGRLDQRWVGPEQAGWKDHAALGVGATSLLEYGVQTVSGTRHISLAARTGWP